MFRTISLFTIFVAIRSQQCNYIGTPGGGFVAAGGCTNSGPSSVRYMCTGSATATYETFTVPDCAGAPSVTTPIMNGMGGFTVNCGLGMDCWVLQKSYTNTTCPPASLIASIPQPVGVCVPSVGSSQMFSCSGADGILMSYSTMDCTGTPITFSGAACRGFGPSGIELPCFTSNGSMPGGGGGNPTMTPAQPCNYVRQNSTGATLAADVCTSSGGSVSFKATCTSPMTANFETFATPDCTGMSQSIPMTNGLNGDVVMCGGNTCWMAQEAYNNTVCTGSLIGSLAHPVGVCIRQPPPAHMYMCSGSVASIAAYLTPDCTGNPIPNSAACTPIGSTGLTYVCKSAPPGMMSGSTMVPGSTMTPGSTMVPGSTMTPGSSTMPGSSMGPGGSMNATRGMMPNVTTTSASNTMSSSSTMSTGGAMMSTAVNSTQPPPTVTVSSSTVVTGVVGIVLALGGGLVM